MLRNLSLFLGAFLVGAVIALGARAVLFEPHAGDVPPPAAGGEYDPMVSNPLAPPETAPASPAPTDPHAGHAMAVTPEAGAPVNTVCAICGMAVDPSLPTAEYAGKVIGFGCPMCPPKFQANPDKYGPSYLRNERFKP